MPFAESFINLDKPLVAVIQGACVGVGFTLLGFCDYIIAEKNTYFDAPLVKLAQVK
jgi:enoyl-CoA hydratase/carnithine racemase